MEATMKNDEFKTVKVVSTMIEAEMFKQRLESEGIETTILSQKDTSFMLTIGEMADIQVIVQNSDEEKAKEIINNIF